MDESGSGRVPAAQFFAGEPPAVLRRLVEVSPAAVPVTTAVRDLGEAPFVQPGGGASVGQKLRDRGAEGGEVAPEDVWFEVPDAPLLSTLRGRGIPGSGCFSGRVEVGWYCTVYRNDALCHQCQG